MESNVLVIVGAIGGALVGGGIAFGVAVWRERYKENKIKEGFLNLLISDIDSLLKLYNELIGKNIKQHDESKIFTSYLVAKQDYFSVFNSNSDKILYLDDKTAKLIIQFYNRAKAHIDTIVRYGEHFENYCNLQPSITDDHLGRLEGRMKHGQATDDLRRLFEFIKNDYLELKRMALATLLALKRQSKKYKKDQLVL